MTREEIISNIAKLKRVLVDLEDKVDIQFNKEQALKLTLNSIYGSIGNQYFTFFDPDLAEAITVQGKELILYAEKITEHYFKNLWIKDLDLHEKLGIKIIRDIDSQPNTKYIDTDSVDYQTVITTENLKTTISNLFFIMKKIYDVNIDERKNEIININNNISVLNYSKNEIKQVPIKKLIRHKVTKPKWRIKTKSGKFVDVTNDHSIIIFRNGEKISIKASEINIKTDKVLSIST
jgi:hypothetical protein